MSLIKKIKEKKELSGLPDELVKDSLNSYSKKHDLSLENLSRKEEKILIKEIRKTLRESTGRFQKGRKNRKKLLENNDIPALLKTHSSTAERLEFYPKLKKTISQMKPKSILDLGCGLNPIALATPKTRYFASDIKEDDLLLVKSYFEKNKIQGKTFFCDLRKPLNKLPKADLCLIFKTLDILGDKRLTEKILKDIKARAFLISFSTKKLSGKPMSHPRRIWFEKILERLGIKYKTFSSINEIFYLFSLESGTT